ncbi:MAG: pyridoxamine kinase [Bacteroidales bacterium]|nr:pyridoxamine kinase [Bacteroidales bacterium]MBR4349744.1 pyridoxamine kinase [Bacteroidales bacterium]MBR6265272.1 pyridoxamine kinase [Bacteroidales bacterium]
MNEKKLLTIQDISCVGQCSLTVALPVISAMGIETAILPSAILSTHTGGFTGYTFHDLTEDIPAIKEHWKKENIRFDAFYTGYVGSVKQLEYISDIMDELRKPDSIIIVDPVMGDKGKLYPGFEPSFAKEMAKLCKKADVIVPNLTEAAFMLDEEYIESGHTKEYIERILKKLMALGCKNALLTGVNLEPGKLGIAAYNGETNEITYYFRDLINGMFHGTGDVFASSFAGAMTLGKSVDEAGKIAVDFTVDAIAKTIDDKSHWYGVKFELALPELIKSIR